MPKVRINFVHNSLSLYFCMIARTLITMLKRLLPYSDKIWRGFNLAMDQNDFFGVDLIWRWRKYFKFGFGFNFAMGKIY